MAPIMGLLRRLANFVCLIGLITLPIWITPFLNGLIEGTFLLQLIDDGVSRSKQQLADGLKSSKAMYRFAFPGVLGIQHTPLPPYHIVQLREPVGWWLLLGLKRFDVDTIFRALQNERDVVDFLARLNTLYRLASPKHDRAKQERLFEQDKNHDSWHHFVYASAQPARLEGMYLDEWDAAFDELLRYHYVNPAIVNARFHYISCPGSLLCDAAYIRGPSLLHFTTDTPTLFDDGDGDQKYTTDEFAGYNLVTVRVIEFPITDPEQLGLAPGVFPSQLNQLRSVTADSYAWERYEPLRQAMQLWFRLQDSLKVKKQRHIWTYGPLTRLEGYVFYIFDRYDVLGLQGEHQSVQFFSRTIGTVTSASILRVMEAIISSLEDIVNDIRGKIHRSVNRLWFRKGKEGTPSDKIVSAGHQDDYQPPGIEEFVDALMHNLVDTLPDDVREEASWLLDSEEMRDTMRKAAQRYQKLQSAVAARKARVQPPMTRRDPQISVSMRT